MKVSEFVYELGPLIRRIIRRCSQDLSISCKQKIDSLAGGLGLLRSLQIWKLGGKGGGVAIIDVKHTPASPCLMLHSRVL